MAHMVAPGPLLKGVDVTLHRLVRRLGSLDRQKLSRPSRRSQALWDGFRRRLLVSTAESY